MKSKSNSKVFEKRVNDSTPKLSASSKKLCDPKGNISFDTSNVCSEDYQYRIIDISALFSAIKSVLCCNKCHGDIVISEKSSVGLFSTFVAKCNNCGELVAAKSSKLIGNKKKIFQK